MAEKAKKGPLEQAAEGAVKGAREAVEGVVQGARDAVQEVQEALGGAVETATDVAAQGEAGGEAETILPGTPANEDELGGKKGATNKRRKDA